MKLRKRYFSSCQIQIILENLKEYKYQRLDPEIQVCHLSNGISVWQDIYSNVIAKAHPDKYDKNFDALLACLFQHVEKQGPMMNAKVASVSWLRLVKRQKISQAHRTIRRGIELTKYSKSRAQCRWHRSRRYLSSGIMLNLLMVRRPKRAQRS